MKEEILVKKLEAFDGQNPWSVFSDFIQMSAAAMASRVCGDFEQEFNAMSSRYNKAHMTKMSEMLAILAGIADEYVVQGKFIDVCGRVYHLINMHNSKTGQFFTPQHIADLTAGCITRGWLEESIKTIGMVHMHEPAAGGGAMILAAATRMFSLGYDPRRYLFVEAGDIDKTCVSMNYVQLMLYGIPAIVVHGDALSKEKPWGVLTTMAYIEEYPRIRKMLAIEREMAAC